MLRKHQKHTCEIIPRCVSAGIIYSRGKWTVTDITAAHSPNKTHTQGYSALSSHGKTKEQKEIQNNAM